MDLLKTKKKQIHSISLKTVACLFLCFIHFKRERTMMLLHHLLLLLLLSLRQLASNFASFSYRRANAQPGGGWCMGVQPVGQSDLRELAHLGRSGIEDAAGVPGTAGFLSQHLRPRQDPASIRRRRGCRRLCRFRSRRHQLRPHQLRQGLGTQVLAAGGHFLSVLARGALGTV